MTDSLWYKTREFLSDKVTALDEFLPEGRNGSAAAEDKFSHSVSSRWWLENSIVQVFEDAQGPFFGIWLGWDERWIVWNMRTGKRAIPKPNQQEQWNQKTRQWARAIVARKEYDPGTLLFLGNLRYRSDRLLVEQFLVNRRFSCWSGAGMEGDKLVRDPYSIENRLAELMLQKWDGKVVKGKIEDLLDSMGDPYLSTAEVIVSPVPENSSVTVSLYEADADKKRNPAKDNPISIGIITQAMNDPSSLARPRRLCFRFCGITPGEYQVKIIQKKDVFASQARAGAARASLGVPVLEDRKSTGSAIRSAESPTRIEIKGPVIRVKKEIPIQCFAVDLGR